MSMESGARRPFVHLHCHTHYSLLDGANRIPDLVSAAKTQGSPAIAITDHGNMFGAIEFYQAAIAAGIKPIIGLEAYIAPGDRRSRDAKGMSEASYHLLLIASNLAGYRNLMKLTTIAHLEGFYYRPRIDREVLAAHHEGLICTSTCLGAEIPQALVKRDRAAAEEIAEWYLGVFGAERFFIELQDHGIPEQRDINPELVDIARRKGIGLVATNDVHYLRSDDVEAHDILCCISTRALQSDTDRFKFPSDQFYLKTPEEMSELFADQPEALSNTVAIAERCNLELDFKARHTPVYPTPKGKSAEEHLRELVYQGAAERYANVESPMANGEKNTNGDEHASHAGGLPAELKERIDYELEVIQSKGFSSYFLIVWDFVHYARSKGIPCGARGSGCSSVVAYCLYLSQPDPLRYGLYFERFMDPDRDEMPDIDVDICQDGREDVLQYVRSKYGQVAQIITFNALKARAAIRDVCRVLGVSLAEADRLAKLVPEALGMTLDRALEQEPDLRRQYEEDARVRKVIDIGRRIEGLARNPGVHAAGVVIADQPLDTLLPLYKASNSDQILTQYEGTTVEKVGLLKMDLLGLRTLSVLARTCQLVERNHGRRIDLERLNLDDPRVYALFATGQTKGVFQFESGGMRDVLMKMRPNRIEDLIAANALYRPGPMVNIDAYIARKHGERWTTPHRIMSEVLSETYGIIVYQEQVARLVNQLGGIERKRAFRLAKAISKKKTAMIEAERAPFVEGCVRNGLDKKTAEDIFNQILPFGEYAFNKAHSTGYALVAYQTAYLKTYYPLEFMAASLTYEKGNTDSMVEYIEECRRLGIDVRPPDVNDSDADFTVVRSGPGARAGFIRFGLAGIKGIGTKAVERIQAARQDGTFADLFDFCERVDPGAVNRGVIEALIKAGAFDSTGAMRKALMSALDRALQMGSEAQRDRQAGQMSLFGGDGTGAPRPEPAAGQLDSAARRPGPVLSSEEWTEGEMLAHEKAVLGMYVTKHPLTQYAELLRRYATHDCADLARAPDGSEVVLGGMISRMRTVLTKSGRNAGSKLAVLTFEDPTGSIEAVVFSEELEACQQRIGPDKVVFLKGAVDRRRESPQVRVAAIYDLEEGPPRLAEAVMVTLKAPGLGRGELERLRSVCAAHAGDRPLYLKLETAGAMTTLVRCGERLRVLPDPQFVMEVEAVTGMGTVEICGARGRARPGMDRVARRNEPEAAESAVAAEAPGAAIAALAN